MLVARTVNNSLRAYRAWIWKSAVEKPEMDKPKAYLDQLDFVDTVPNILPTMQHGHYQPSSGEAAAAASSRFIAGEAVLS